MFFIKKIIKLFYVQKKINNITRKRNEVSILNLCIL